MNRSSFIRHLSTIDFRKGFDGVPDEFLGKLSVEAIKYLRLTVLRLETTAKQLFFCNLTESDLRSDSPVV